MTSIRSAFWLSATVALIVATTCAPAPDDWETRKPIRLVVVVSVDQLPEYLLDRYDTLFTAGLRRLLDGGRRYTQAVYDHAETWTSSGHATLATGVHPSRHGIVANRWWNEEGGGRVSSVGDPDETVLGAPESRGGSPRNLRVTGLPDWLAAADSGARIVSISGKSTTAVFLAGHTRGHVYYYYRGRFATSSYYRDAYPDWVERFNDEVLPGLYADSVWESLVPPEQQGLARQDGAAYEGDHTHTTFPHRFVEEASDPDDPLEYYSWWTHTPALDVAILALARAAVTSLSLGRRDSPEYLAVGLTATDWVGHPFGPLSLEQLDNLLRLDRELGEFLEFLDGDVGEGSYVLVLSSDHGVQVMPEYRQQLRLSGKRVTSNKTRTIERVIEETSPAGSPKERRAAIAATLESFDFVADAITVDELTGEEQTDSFLALYQHSHYPGRFLYSEGLFVRLQEGVIWQPKETQHGSPYLPDRHVPLIFMGPGIEAGTFDDPVRTVDVAPTLARLAGIPFPDDLDGRPLFGIPYSVLGTR